jgi:hypothetical protein
MGMITIGFEPNALLNVESVSYSLLRLLKLGSEVCLNH